jgi:hypothetical protein
MNLTFLFLMMITTNVLGFDFAAAEEQVECPAGPQRAPGSIVQALERAPCEIFPLERFNTDASMQERCHDFSESLNINCRERSNFRSSRQNLDCLASYYGGTREGSDIQFNADQVYRNHVDRAGQLYDAYARMVELQASFATNQNSYATSRLEAFKDDETNPVAQFSCNIFNREEFRQEVMKCNSDITTVKLHRLLDAVEFKDSATSLEQMVRDNYLVAMEEIEGGVREAMPEISRMETGDFVQEVLFLREDSTERMFYLTSEEMAQADPIMSFLNFRRDYGDNVQEMLTDVRTIMDQNYNRLAQANEVGSNSEMFGAEGFPNRRTFRQRRDEYLNEIGQRYRMMLVLRDVVESAVIPSQVPLLEGTINSASALRAQLQNSVNANGIDIRDLQNTGWFEVGDNNEVDFNREFFDFLQSEINRATSNNKLDQLRTIRGVSALWYRFQHAQLAGLNESCQSFQREVNQLCEAIEAEQIVMTDIAASSCYEDQSTYGNTSRVEFAHHMCAGRNGYLLNGEIPESVSDYFSPAPARGVPSGENGGGVDPTSSEGGVVTSPNPAVAGDPARDLELDDVPTGMGGYYNNQIERRSERAIRARERNNTTVALNGPSTLTDIVDQSEQRRAQRGNGLFGNLFDSNNTNPENGGVDQGSWDFLTRSTGEPTDGETEDEELVGEGLLEPTETLAEPEDDETNAILDRISQLESELQRREAESSAESNPSNDPRIAELMRQIREQREELDRMREERDAARTQVVRQRDVERSTAARETSPRRNNTTTRRRAIAAPSQELGQNEAAASSFERQAPLDRGVNRVIASDGPSESYETGVNYGTQGFESAGYTNALTLTTREIASVAQIPSTSIVTSPTDQRLVNLQPGEVLYLQVDNGIFIKHEKNSEGEIIRQEVRLQRDLALLSDNAEVTEFQSQTPNINRVIVRLEAIEQEAGIK